LTVATPDATAAAAAMAPNAGPITGIPASDLYAATADWYVSIVALAIANALPAVVSCPTIVDN